MKGGNDAHLCRSDILTSVCGAVAVVGRVVQLLMRWFKVSRATDTYAPHRYISWSLVPLSVSVLCVMLICAYLVLSVSLSVVLVHGGHVRGHDQPEQRRLRRHAAPRVHTGRRTAQPLLPFSCIVDLFL
jgi:hypothetical protein